jgi:hypothetical protein
MFWNDLKLWQIFKTKHKIWQTLCTFKNLYFSKFNYKKNHIWVIGFFTTSNSWSQLSPSINFDSLFFNHRTLNIALYKWRSSSMELLNILLVTQSPIQLVEVKSFCTCILCLVKKNFDLTFQPFIVLVSW